MVILLVLLRFGLELSDLLELTTSLILKSLRLVGILHYNFLEILKVFRHEFDVLYELSNLLILLPAHLDHLLIDLDMQVLDLGVQRVHIVLLHQNHFIDVRLHPRYLLVNLLLKFREHVPGNVLIVLLLH